MDGSYVPDLHVVRCSLLCNSMDSLEKKQTKKTNKLIDIKPDRINMKRLIIFALVLLLPSAVSEISHSPDEVGEGDPFTALLDTEDNVVSVTFYVSTLEEPYTCYKPETV